jgi:hypothetical protein
LKNGPASLQKAFTPMQNGLASSQGRFAALFHIRAMMRGKIAWLFGGRGGLRLVVACSLLNDNVFISLSVFVFLPQAANSITPAATMVKMCFALISVVPFGVDILVNR